MDWVKSNWAIVLFVAGQPSLHIASGFAWPIDYTVAFTVEPDSLSLELGIEAYGTASLAHSVPMCHAQPIVCFRPRFVKETRSSPSNRASSIPGVIIGASEGSGRPSPYYALLLE